jgi:hypothetical protein
MKRFIQKLVAIAATASMLCTGVMGVTANAAENTPITGSGSASAGGGTNSPMVHYNYNIPNFYLVSGETAFTTRRGYGFDVSTEGLNHNDFDITFYASGSSVNLTLAVLTLDNYVNGNYNTYVQSKTVYGAGSKEVNFYDLDYGTYVIKWINNNSYQVNISSANLSTSY